MSQPGAVRLLLGNLDDRDQEVAELAAELREVRRQREELLVEKTRLEANGVSERRTSILADIALTAAGGLGGAWASMPDTVPTVLQHGAGALGGLLAIGAVVVRVLK